MRLGPERALRRRADDRLADLTVQGRRVDSQPVPALGEVEPAGVEIELRVDGIAVDGPADLVQEPDDGGLGVGDGRLQVLVDRAAGEPAERPRQDVAAATAG